MSIKKAPITSVAVVFWWDFLDAVKAAEKFAGPKKPFVRIDLVPEEDIVIASAVTPYQVAAVEADASWMDVGSPDDLAFEISASAIRLLQAHFPYRRDWTLAREDQPLIQIDISKERVFFYDASGLNLHLYKFYVERSLELEVPEGVAQGVEKFARHSSSREGELDTWQMKNIQAACAVLKIRPRFEFFDPGDDRWVRSKVLTQSGRLTVMSTVIHNEKLDGKLPDKEGTQEDLSFSVVEAAAPKAIA